MDEQNQAPAQQPQEETTPEWNQPKPVEEELQKYSSGKTLKVFMIFATIIIVAAIGIFIYKLTVDKQTPEQQIRQEPVVVQEEEVIAPVEEEKTAEEQLEELDAINLEELDETDALLDETELEDLDL